MACLERLKLPCNKMYHLDRCCTAELTCNEVYDERLKFWGPTNKRAPTDRERSKKIMDILMSPDTRMDDVGNLTFTVGPKRRRVCTGAFLRIKGLKD
jgi:hypothetical protein